MRRTLPLLALLALVACVPAASARVVVIAGGDRAATLTDVSTDRVAGRIALPGRARTVAVAPDGSRAWLGAGSRVVPVDLTARVAAAPIAIGARIPGLAVSPDGARLYAARRGQIATIDTAGPAVSGRIRTPGATARALTASRDGTRLAALSGDRLLLISLRTGHIL